MIAASRRWLRRNRTPLAVGCGLVGVTYVAGQYLINKIVESRERMSADRIGRENLRRRFQQNQEDCTLTVLALLPTAAEDIFDVLPVEQITHELQQQRAERLGRSGASEGGSTGLPSSGSPSVTEEDGKSMSSFHAESFIHTSQMGASSLGNGDSDSPKPTKTKMQLWAELKISALTRAFTLLYTLAFLTLLTRIQLNLLGRRNYLSSVVHLASRVSHDSTIKLENRDDDRAEKSYGHDFETNRKFLTFSWWLLHRGWREIMHKVEAAVTEVFGPLNPREDITLERLSHLVVEVRKRIEGSTEEERRTHKWLPYLLPPREQEDLVLQESGEMPPPPPDSSPMAADPSSSLTSNFPIRATTTSSLSVDPLRRLLDETADLIDSPTATHILTLLLDVLFSHLIDTVLRTQAFKLGPPTPLLPGSRIEDISDALSESAVPDAQAKAKIATILAVVSRQAHAMRSGVPNDYVQAMEEVREVEAFAAVVYSCNWEFEGLDMGRKEENEEHAEPVQPVGSLNVVEAVRDGGSEVVRGAWGMVGSVWGAVVGRGQASIVA